MKPLQVVIGYDEREAAAIYTFAHSIMRTSSKPVSFTFLARNQFEFHDPNQKEDYPQSNAFIFSRFLTPSMMNYEGWALFADGDMLCMDDISKLFDLAEEDKAVMVVPHKYSTKYPIKYLGAKNEDYPRKNWSSVVLFNCAHPANKVLTKEFIESQSGAYLHRFGWLRDYEIGYLPAEWNWLEKEYAHNDDTKLVHWTVAGPYFKGYEDADYSTEWAEEYKAMTRCDQEK